MTDKQHISMMEWAWFYSGQKEGRGQFTLQQRVMKHLGICPECRKLYEKATALQDAASKIALLNSVDAREDAYLAVASGNTSQSNKAEIRGRLCVYIVSKRDHAQFVEGTWETSGFANRYALNAENDGRDLLDDGDSLRLYLRGDHLTIVLTEPNVICSYQLLPETGEELRGTVNPNGAVTEIPLLQSQFLTLELVFSRQQ